jgi:HK97 gp10 family phage protein
MADDPIIVVQIFGVPQAQRRLESYSRRVQRDLQEVLDIYAFLIQRQAQVLAPVDTGFLRNNIFVEVDTKWSRIIEATAEYAIFVEYGTRYTQAQPFLAPAARAYQRDFRNACQDAINDAWRGHTMI